MAILLELGFPEGSGTTTADSSGNGRDCTVGPAAWATGHTGGGVAPNNANTVTFPALGSGGSTFTIMGWVRRTGAPGSGTTVCNVGTASAVRWNLQNDGSISALSAHNTGVIPESTWTHVAFVADGATARTCYVNGVSVSADSGQQAFISASATYALTSNATAYLQWDDFRIYDNALTQGEVETAMNTPVTSGPEPVTGTLAADLPEVSVGSLTASISGVLSGPPVTGTLGAGLPAVTVAPPTASMAGTYFDPEVRTGSVSATLPTIAVAVPTVSASGDYEPPPAATVDVTLTLSGTASPRVILTEEDGAGIEWRTTGGSVLSTSLTPTLSAGTVVLRASSATAVDSINFGFNSSQDSGTYNIGSGHNLATQPLTGVSGLNGLTGLRYFMCNSSTLVGALDLSGMASLEHLECFGARLTSVELDGCSSLIRLCLEANRLTALDLNPVAATLRDLRAALNNNIAFATQTETLEVLYHHCTRGQAATNYIPFEMMPVVEEYWVWSSQATAFPVPASTTVRSFLAYSNQLTQANVNAILVALDTLGRPTGNVQLQGGSNAGPSGAGAVAAASLRSKGWNVQVNVSAALSAMLPGLTVGAPTSAMSGTVTVPTYSGDLAASAPEVIVGPVTMAGEGTVQPPTGSAVMTASLPTIVIGAPTATIGGTVALPDYSGDLAASTPDIEVGPPTLALTGAVTAPSWTGTMAATLPAITVGPMTAAILDQSIPPLPIDGVTLAITTGSTRSLAISTEARDMEVST